MKKEDDGWKIWHVVEGNDITVEAATDVSKLPALAYKDAPRPANPTAIAFGQPDYPMTVFDPKFGWYAFPRIPDAHDSYNLDMSCSMEACLKFLAGRMAKKDVAGLYALLGGDGK